MPPFVFAQPLVLPFAQQDTAVELTDTTAFLPDSLWRPEVDPRVWSQLNSLPPLQRPVVFVSDLQPRRVRPAGEEQPDWLFFWLMALVLLIVVIRVQFSRDLREWWRALGNQNLAHQLQRDREFALTAHGILLFALFCSSLGTWCWLVLQRLGVEGLPFAGTLSLGRCIVGVIFVVFVRDALRRLTGMLFRAEDDMALFGFDITLLQAVAGILLLPFLFLMAYAPEILAGAMAITSALMLLALFGLRSFRGLEVGAGPLRRNGFAFVLYICTLEIAPLAVAFKGLTDWLSSG